MSETQDQKDVEHAKFLISKAMFTIRAAICAANDTAKSPDFVTGLLERAAEQLEAIRQL